ncbi:MAG: hypothetical protein WBP08_08285, partial [Saprospiraceae bacterium]
MKTKTTFDIVKFRLELRSLKDNIKHDLSDQEYIFLIYKIIPKIRQHPENILLIFNKKDDAPYNTLKSIISKIKNIYEECLIGGELDEISNTDKSNDFEIENNENYPRSLSTFEKSKITNNHMGQISDIDLKKFIETIVSKNNSLTARAQNVLDFQIIPNLISGQIQIHELLFERNFTRFRNCGKKSANELVKFFILNLQNFNLPQEELKNPNSTVIESPNFNIQTIITLLEINKGNLSVRSLNGLDIILNNIKSNPESIFEYTNENKILDIDNVGKKSASELSSFFIDIINELTALCKLDSNKKIKDGDFPVKLWQFEKSLGLCKNELSNYLNNKIYFLTILEKLIYKNFKDREIQIILKYFNAEKTSLESIALKHRITRERVRQLIPKIKLKLLKLKKKLCDIIEEQKVDVIKTWEGNPKFNISEIILKEKLSLPESLLEFLITENDSRSNKSTQYWKNDEITQLIKFDELLKTIQDLNKKVTVSFTLSLSGLIYNHLIDKNDTQKIENIKNEIEAVIFKLVGLITDLEGNLLFERNTKEKGFKIIAELFELENRPMHLIEVSEITGKSIDQLRSIMLKYNKIFINTALSTYGLKKWE